MSTLEAEKIKSVAAPPVVEKDTVYVTIPATDLYDNTYPIVQLNAHKFEPGLTYEVPTAVGAEIEDRMKRFNKEQVRLLRPKADTTSLQQVNKGSVWGRIAPSNSADAAFASVSAQDKVITINW